MVSHYRDLRRLVAASLIASLAACGGGQSTTTATTSVGAQLEVAETDATQALLVAGTPVAGATPFISFVTLQGSAVPQLSSINFVVLAKPGTVSKRVSVTYTMDYLTRRGYATAGSASVQIPIFGLYAGFENTVALNFTFNDTSTYTMPVTITTAAWTDPNATYDRPTVVQARAAGSSLGFDFLYMKSELGAPVVVDTDGIIRWVGPNVTGAMSSNFTDGGFIVGSGTSADLYRLEMDGTYNHVGSLASTGVVDFSHDIEDGKTGQLDNVDTDIGGTMQIDSTAQELTSDGQVTATWDLASIISAAMSAGGDDPTQFVRPGVDWFHMNTAIYDATDDSVIISSRENFVIKLDYQTGAIRWIMGDPTKYWYTFPSLRAKALAWVGDGLVPIGQHAVTIAPDGSLMLFNDGYQSLNQPAGAPAGQSRAYSTVSDYVIDEVAGTVQEAWHFDYGQSISSLVCSSARATSDGSILVDYAFAEGGTAARIVGLDPARNVVFDLRYANAAGTCDTAWNSQPLALDAMSFQ